MTPKETAHKIAAMLHESRGTHWNSDTALQLSAAMRGKAPEVLAMALITYSTGLLRASRQVVALEIDCANGQIARDEGRLQ